MTSSVKVDFSKVGYMPLEVKYVGSNSLEMGLGFEGEDVTIKLTIEEAKDIIAALENELKEIGVEME